MTPGRTRAIGLAAIVFVIVCLILAGWLSIQNSHAQPGQIRIVGSVTAPHVSELQSDLRCRIAGGCNGEPGGDKLVSSFTWLTGILVTTIALVWVSSGSLILSRQPGNWAGWIFLILGVSFCVALFAQEFTVYTVTHDATPPGALAVLGEIGLVPFVVLPLLVLLFPDGHTPSPRWRLAVWGLLGGAAVANATLALKPGPLNNYVDSGILYVNPLGLSGIDRIIGPVATAGALVAILSALSVVPATTVRYRRSGGKERLQLRLLALVGSTAVVLFALAMISGFLEGESEHRGQISPSDVFLLLMALTVILGIPAAYLVAIVRHGLWDLEVVIRKTRIALVLAVVIVIPTIAVIALLSQSLAWEATPKIVTFVGGVLIGALLIPVIIWERKLARRITYGRRATGYQVLATFGEQVGESYSVEDVAPRMVRVLAEATGATSVRVQLRVGTEVRQIAAFGEAHGFEHTFPVVDGGDELGSLEVAFPPDDPIDPTKEQLIRDLAAQASLVLRNVRLLEELRASRQRLVVAQDEERRKLERNIHDGVQQQLVALAVRLKLADTLVDRDPAKAHEALAALQADAGATLDDLRDLARGIYPPLLADKGLVSALEAQARKATVPTQVAADGIGRYPRDVESTVYFCTLEALNNMAKYADASRATVSLSQVDGHLTFTVTDDGAGFDSGATSYGTGLQGMADRLDAIGGNLDVTSAPGAGTTVTGRVPVLGG